jgi:heat shock protein 1/8
MSAPAPEQHGVSVVEPTKASPENVEKASKLKEIGNSAFAKGDHQGAIAAFTEALTFDPNNVALLSNRSAAYAAIGNQDPENYRLAEADGATCTKLMPEWSKGYVRQATALFYQKKYKEAVLAYASGLARDPSSRLLSDGLAAAQKHLAESATDQEDQEVVIGIDLGTTYSCVGVWQNNTVVMIPNDRGAITTPSYVNFTDTGKRSVGSAAKNLAARYPSSTIYDVKRFIGQRFEDEGVSQDVGRLTYSVVPSVPGAQAGTGTGAPLIKIDMGMHGLKTFAPEEVSAMVLSYLKKTAETFLKKPVYKAVITVPAYFNDSQRAATKAAGRIAGLDVLRIINEPTAAALSYGLDRLHKDKPAKVLIFDLGGGTFDVSLLTLDGGVTEVKATAGDTRLGGEDFDVAVTKFLMSEAVASGMPDMSNDSRVMRRLQTAAEAAKRQLSQTEEAQIHVESLFSIARGKGQPKLVDFTYTLSRAKFESLNAVYFTKCLETVKKVLKDGKMKASEIDDIVLVGGSTRVPKMQQLLQEFFGGKKLCRSLNPDEAVAYGAAVQGAILTGARSKATDNLLLLDVTPLSLGIETTGRVMSVIIPRNSPIPCVKTQTYTTEENYQTEIDVCVYEGERSRTDQNNLLGKFSISGIEKAKRGVPKIDVSFSLDSNGMLAVSAKDQTTGAEAHIQIQRSGRSSEAEVERMVAEAEKYRREDDERTKKVEAINDLETLISEARQIVGDLKDARKGEQLEASIEEVEQWVQQHGEEAKLTEIKLKRSKLSTAITKVSR